MPMHPAGSVTSPTRQNTTYDNQIRSGDITLLDTPGLPAPQPAALYHMGSDLLGPGTKFGNVGTFHQKFIAPSVPEYELELTLKNRAVQFELKVTTDMQFQVEFNPGLPFAPNYNAIVCNSIQEVLTLINENISNINITNNE